MTEQITNCVLDKVYTDLETGLTHFSGDIEEFEPTDTGQQVIIKCEVEGCVGEIELTRDTPQSLTADLNLDSVRTAVMICKTRGGQ